ncbi:hypothetical protein Hypma_015351 [Hypsizygus marmoreus]|uniref:Uncharacterized protein n=1 Tax=Hypsizygus marmoreus TaxID=39966 RepID=A0A369KCX9_HYPMA|nr:hypothetical protein Hypma_015351 [Hypsizygus marmoreus]
MAELGTNSETAKILDDATVDGLATSLGAVAVQDEASQTEPANPEKTGTSSRPMRIYTRPQLLFLYKSPLVRPPPDMPELKDWFGSENEQNLSKKDSEPSTPSSARERRFRRDADDGETSSRPSFRPTLSQPSQMGNFKHQSLRASDRDKDRDRDRDGDKDRERDIRDKEGQERLRHLSDKYDRDRLASPLTGLRKERDTAPHLSSGSTSRLGSQAQGTSVTSSRRAENREAAKKKAGEVSEDWRRGAELRSAREERTDGGRKDRGDDRERARSRVRDTSRSRREPSTSRRERDREERDKARDREDYRRERDRDADHDGEDDARRWRDDGKRDERMAARRGERHQDQHRERERARDKDSAPDAGDRRWVAAEERDGRSKRASGRERKSGPLADDGKDRDDRRDREREPAWMDTYIPTTSNTGILGGKGVEGELDEIQAWKRERKEKELKDKGVSSKGDGIEVQETSAEKPEGDARQLDEIQLFRLLMKREEEKKSTDTQDSTARTTSPASSLAPPTEKARLPQSVITSNDTPALSPPSQASQPAQTPAPLQQSELHTLSTPSLPHSLLSLLGAKEPSNMSASSSDVHSNKSRTPPSSKVVASHATQENAFLSLERPALDSVPPQFNPPPGSRLLAFARTSSAATKPQTTNNLPTVPPNGPFNVGNSQSESTEQIPPKMDPLRSKPGFSPFEDPLRPTYLLEEHRESSNFTMTSDIHRRGSAERSSFSPSTETGAFQDNSPSLENGAGYSASKGSRFAKFFDGKGREALPPVGKVRPPGGIVSSSPSPGGQRQEHGVFNNGVHGGPDPRAMDEIYAMLSSSAQGPRGAPGHIPSSAPLSNNGSFGLQAQNLHLLQQQLHQQHQQHQQQQQIHASRLEPLYESRLDDRNFVPDGMVPGLRSAPPPRNRENVGLYPDSLDEGLHFNVQRLPPQQQRGLDQLYPGAPPSLFPQQGGRNGNIPIQQHYRGGPSPISHQQNILPTSQQQRLPPGLANLGGRPPHEPSQFLGMPGMPAPGLHGALHLNGSVQQQQFNNFPPGYGGPQMRGPHQLQTHGTHHPMGGMGHPSNMDLRAANQNQLLGLGGLRGAGGGFSGQQGPAAQIPAPLLAMRQQQQQQQLPPHMMPHLLPPHLQQQGLSGPNNQPTHDLMALLMGGAHRE